MRPNREQVLLALVREALAVFDRMSEASETPWGICQEAEVIKWTQLRNKYWGALQEMSFD